MWFVDLEKGGPVGATARIWGTGAIVLSHLVPQNKIAKNLGISLSTVNN